MDLSLEKEEEANNDQTSTYAQKNTEEDANSSKRNIWSDKTKQLLKIAGFTNDLNLIPWANHTEEELSKKRKNV